MKKFFILITVFTMCFTFMNVMADTPYSVSLSAPEYVFCGQEFEVEILIDTSGCIVGAVAFYLTYDPSLFEFADCKSTLANIRKIENGKLSCATMPFFTTFENDILATLTFRAISEKIASPNIICESTYDDEWTFFDERGLKIPEEQISYGSVKIDTNCHHSSDIASFVYYKDHTLIQITPKDELLNKRICIVFYNDNKISDIKVRTCSDGSISFISYATYNKIKIMISHNINSVFPMYCHETIE